MKKDIIMPIVEKVHVAIVRELSEDGIHFIWNVYLINQQNEDLQKVMVSSEGYKMEENGDKTVTSTLRHFFEKVPKNSFFKIEPILDNIFHLNNEYFISFFNSQGLFDKKYIFLAESIQEKNFTTIPYMNKKGVMI